MRINSNSSAGRGILRVALLLNASILATLGAGCSKSSAPTEFKKAGLASDPQYQLASLAFAVADSTINASIARTFMKFQGRLGRGVFKDSTLTYHESSRYWYRSVSGEDTIKVNARVVDTRTITMTDSIQFMEGIYIVQFPDSFRLTQIQSGFEHYVVSDSTHDILRVTHNLRMIGNAGAIWGKGTVSLNGGGGKLSGVVHRLAGWGGVTGDCTVKFDFSTLMDHVILNLDDFLNSSGCPSDGKIIHSSVLDGTRYGMDSTIVGGQWISTREFMGNLESYVVEYGTTNWQTAISCPPSSASVFGSYLTSEK